MLEYTNVLHNDNCIQLPFWIWLLGNVVVGDIFKSAVSDLCPLSLIVIIKSLLVSSSTKDCGQV